MTEYICDACGSIHEEYHYDCPNCTWGTCDEATYCKSCESAYSEGGLRDGLCEKCIDDVVQVDLALDYIMAEDLRKEYFVEHWFLSEVDMASESLIDICEKNWKETYLSNLTSDRAKSDLFRFIRSDLSHYIESCLKRKDRFMALV